MSLVNFLALHPNSYFGLITFSDRIGLWNLHSSLPHVFQLFIPQSGECSVYIEDVFPNGRLFVQVY